MQRRLSVMFLAAATSASANSFVTATMDPAQEHLVITTADGHTIEPARIPEQVGFDHPLISADGQYAGWLALHPNCCTSYPVPLTLVVLGQDGQRHQFRGPAAIFGWCFVPSRKAVAYRQEVLHGPSDKTFELRRIADGKLLSTFVQPGELDTKEPGNQRLPAWAQCAGK